jgi:hypothetical protein
MKITEILLTLAVLAYSWHSCGDVKIINEMISEEKDGNIKREIICSYTEDKERMEVLNGTIITIIRLDKKVIWSLNSKDKIYGEITPEELNGPDPLKKEEIKMLITETKENKKIGDYECIKVIVVMNIRDYSMRHEVWGTKDIAIDPALVTFTENLDRVFKDNITHGPYNMMMLKLFDMKLYPVEILSEFNIQGEKSKMSTKLKSISTDKLEDSVFEIPNGYNKEAIKNFKGSKNGKKE